MHLPPQEAYNGGVPVRFYQDSCSQESIAQVIDKTEKRSKLFSIQLRTASRGRDMLGNWHGTENSKSGLVIGMELRIARSAGSTVHWDTRLTSGN